MKDKLYIGIDPGKTGGIAWITPEGKAWAMPMPETERDLWDAINSHGGNLDYEPVALLEQVNAGGPRKKGTNSIFTFGAGYGSLRMALTAANIRFEVVAPSKWQKALSCLTGGDKNVSKAKAQQLFPGLKITHAIADALLIAEYNRRTSK